MHRRFVDLLLDQAAELRVPLLAGASFGLDTTRIYLTAATNDLGRPFVRVAAGTEHRLEMERLKLVLGRTVRLLSGLRGPSGPGRGVPAAP
jgi:hypothetical protein